MKFIDDMTFSSLCSHIAQLVLAFFAALAGYAVNNAHIDSLEKVVWMTVVVIAWGIAATGTFFSGETW